MQKIINQLLNALLDFTDNENEVGLDADIDKDDYITEFVTGDDYVKISIRKKNFNEPKPEKNEPTEHCQFKAKVAQCTKIREDFQRYLNELDDSIVLKACKTLGPEKLRQIELIRKSTRYNPELMVSAFNEFKEVANNAIMEQVTKLKSQMTPTL